MKKWTLLVVIGYMLTLVSLTIPVLFAVNNVAPPRASLDEILQIAREPDLAWGWIYLVPFLLSLAFVLIPIGPAPGRWKGRRPVFWSILVISLACAVLLLAAGLSVYYGLPEAWRPGEMISNQPAVAKIVDQDVFWIAMPIVVVVSLWIFWAFIFSLALRREDPNKIPERLVKWMLRGSVLEFCIALVCHILVRRRSECCAEIFTLFGLATGFSMAVLAFGPGVWVLMQIRKQKLRPREAGEFAN